ncbi:MAG: hypothetical protein CM15mP49_22710 [Actinomycetota bacterium]|nr:MAG: hypothetical protein CM15mP49_22710 [Actinomycetota bacterium]
MEIPASCAAPGLSLQIEQLNQNVSFGEDIQGQLLGRNNDKDRNLFSTKEDI